MTPPTEQLEAECASLLMELGFTKYESYVFVYLLRLGSGTAKDVARLNDVPRTRVYDAVETLHEAGLVDVQHSSPQKYTPVSTATAIRKLNLKRENTLTELSELFDQLEPASPPSEDFAVWTVRGRTAVASRVLEFVEDATDEVVYMTVDDLLSDAHLEALEEAAARGVDIYLAGISGTTQERIQRRIPSATVFETLWEWSEAGAGSLLIADQHTALVSVLDPAENGNGGTPTETAIWGTGERNSLVVVLRSIFTWRLDHDEELSDGG